MDKPLKKAGILLVILIVAGIVVRIATRGRGETVESISDIQKREGVPVRAETIKRGTLARTLQFSGTIEGEEQSVVVARVMETVRDVPVKVGQRITRGQVVAKLDDANPQAQFRQSKSVLDNAKMDYDRMQALFAQGAVSKQSLDQTKLAYDVAQSNFAAASELIEMRAPVSGEVVRVHMKPGEIASPGMPLVTIAASKEMRVIFTVSAEERASIKPKQAARIHIAQSDTSWIPAFVDKVEDAADPQTRLFEVTVKSDNPEGLLRPGVLTTVEVVVDERRDVVSVGLDALLADRGQSGDVFVIGDDRKAARRSVSFGMRTADRIECTDGLRDNERVVVYGQNLVTDGDPVKIIEQ